MSQFSIKTSLAGLIRTLTGNAGGPVGPDAGGNIDVIGSGSVTVSGDPGTNTLTWLISGSGLTWNVITTATQAMAENNGYFANHTGGVVFTLPATAAVGDAFTVCAMNADGWTIAQRAGQSIQFGDMTTTVGVGGSLASTKRGDSVSLICNVANTGFFVVPGTTGNITIV